MRYKNVYVYLMRRTQKPVETSWVLRSKQSVKRQPQNRILIGYDMILCKNSYYGLADEQGNVLLDCKYIKICKINDFVYLVASGNPREASRIDSHEYEGIHSFDCTSCNGVFPRLFHIQKGFIEGLNNVVYFSYGYENGEITYSRPGANHSLFGLLSKDGDTILSCVYDSIKVCKDERYIVKQGWNYYIAANRDLKITKAYNNIGTKDKEIFRCWKGTVIPNPKYRNILTPVIGKGQFCFVDKNGKQLFPAQYENCLNFLDGIAAVMKNGHWGYINKAGEQIIPCIFEKAFQFSYGRALVKMNGKYGYIDREGTIKIPCIYSKASDFKKNYYSEDSTIVAETSIGRTQYAIDADGKILFQVSEAEYDDSRDDYQQELHDDLVKDGLRDAFGLGSEGPVPDDFTQWLG